jgi:hypothetical protein
MATSNPSVTVGNATTVALVTQGNSLAASTYADDLSAPPPGDAKVRVVHTVSDVAAVDVFVRSAPPGPTEVNSTATNPSDPPAFSALGYGSASPYAKVPAGSYDVQVRATGSGQIVLSAHSWPVQAGTVASVVVLSGANGVALAVVRDAAGTATIPSGGMATGDGGLARRRSGSAISVGLLLFVTVGIALMVVGFSVLARLGPRKLITGTEIGD